MVTRDRRDPARYLAARVLNPLAAHHLLKRRGMRILPAKLSADASEPFSAVAVVVRAVQVIGADADCSGIDGAETVEVVLGQYTRDSAF